jgi:hypothetical protein
VPRRSVRLSAAKAPTAVDGPAAADESAGRGRLHNPHKSLLACRAGWLLRGDVEAGPSGEPAFG